MTTYDDETAPAPEVPPEAHEDIKAYLERLEKILSQFETEQ